MYVEDCFNVKIGGGVVLETGSKGQGSPYVDVQCTQCIQTQYNRNTVA